MKRIRLLPSVCAVLAGIAMLGPRPGAAYQQSDLQGAWELHSIASGPGAPWWERAHTTFAASGNFTAFASTNLGEIDTVQAAMNLSPTGVLTVPGLGTLLGALDPGTTVMVATDTWSSGSPGTTELKLGVKLGGGYTPSDLAGNWELNILASGPGAPWWQRGRVAVGADGHATGTFTDHEGVSDPVDASFGLSPSGIVTLSVSSVAQGAMDAGRTVMVVTNTWTGFMAGTAELAVGVKMAAAYAPTDLAGAWEVHTLATGPGAPWWSRGRIVVAPDGSFSGTMSQSDGGGGPRSGNLALNSAGVILRTGFPNARGALDAGKSVMVWTDTWTTGSPGTSEITVAVRTTGGTAGVGDDPALEFALDRVHPNPARGRAPRVSFVLPIAAAAQLELLDVSGRRIIAREVGALGAGRHTVELAETRTLPPGLYLVRLRQGTNVRTGRVVVL